MSKLNEKTGTVEILTIQTRLSNPPLPQNFDVKEWLAGQGTADTKLLAHTYDGVIWGYRDAQGWHLSSDAAPTISPPLDTQILLELRLFNAKEEIYLWRDGSHFRTRHIVDGQGYEQECYDEPTILWGTQGTALPDGFTRLEDGSQGLAHAIPITVTISTQNVRPVFLQVRHYIEKDADTGLARVTCSRLIGLTVNPEVKNGSQA